MDKKPILLYIFYYMLTNILLYIGLVLTIALLVWNIITEQRVRRFTRGTNGRSLEGAIGLVLKKMEALEKDNISLHEKNAVLLARQRKAIRNIETVRFNPFADQGSNQSFATALLNDEKNGVVISTLFARDRMSVFAKPIKEGKSEYELTVEEKSVLEKTLHE
jgi:hypothetical protein